jgi:hypothetical protein
MKKHKVELLIILFISALSAFLIPNFMNFNSTIKFPALLEFTIFMIGIFVTLCLSYFAYKPSEKIARIPDGHQKLYNAKNQITKEGIFKGGRLISGSVFTYKKDGSLVCTEIFKEGIFVSKHLAA